MSTVGTRNNLTMKTLFVFLLFLVPNLIFAATFTSSGSGAWSTVIGAPGAGDHVIIQGGHTVTVDGNVTSLDSLRIDPTGVLEFDQSGFYTVQVAGDFIDKGSVIVSNDGSTPGVHTLQVGGDFVGSGDFSGVTYIPNYTSVTLNLNGPGEQSFDLSGATQDYFSINISNSSGTVTTTNSDIVVNGVFTIGASASVTLGSGTITLISNFVVDATATLDATTNNSVLNFTGTNSTNLQVGATFDFYDILLSKNAGKTLSITGGGTARVNGTFTKSDLNTLSVASGTLAYQGAASTLAYTGGKAHTVTSAEWPTTNGPANLVIDNSTQTVSLSTPRTLAGNLSLNSTGEFDCSSTLTVEGNVSVNSTGTFGQSGTGTLVMGGSGASNVSLTKTLNLHNFTVNKTNGTPVTVQLATGAELVTDASAALRVQSGILEFVEAGQLTLGATNSLQIDGGATLKTGGTNIAGFSNYTLIAGGTIEYTGTGAETIMVGQTLANIVVNKTGGTATFASGSTDFQSGSVLRVVDGNLDLNGVTFNTYADSLTVWTNGILQTGGSTISGFTTGGYLVNGEIVFDGSGSAETVPAGLTQYQDLTISNLSGVNQAHSAQLNGVLTFTNGLFNITGGTFTMGGSATAGGMDDGRHVNGAITKVYSSAGSFTIPVGDGTLYRPVTVDVTTGTDVTASYASTDPQVNNTPTSIKSISNARKWTVSSTDATAATVSLVYTSPGFTITNAANMRILRGTSNSTDWSDITASVSAPNVISSSQDLTGTVVSYTVAELAGSYTWDFGATPDNSFTTPANWSGNVVPGAGDVATINGTYTVTITNAGGAADVGSLVINGGAVLTISRDAGNSSLTVNSSASDALNIVSGTLTATTGLSGSNDGYAVVLPNGGITVASGSTVNVGATNNRGIGSGATTALSAGNQAYASGSTFNYTGDGQYFVEDTYGNLTVNPHTNGISVDGGNTTVNNTLTTNGSLDLEVTAGTLSIGALVNNDGLTTSGAAAISVSGSTTNAGTLTLGGTGSSTLNAVSNSGSIVMNANGSLALNGNLSGSGSFSGTDGTVTVSGSSLSGGSTLAFNNLTLNNASGVTLNASATVAGALTFNVDGLLNTGSNSVVLGASGSVSGASSARYVNGILGKLYTSATPFTFPIGKGGDYLPFSYTMASLNGNVTVSVEQFNGDANAYDPDIDASTLSKVSQRHYFQVSYSGNIPNSPQVTLSWNADDMVDGSLIQLDVAQLSGGQWISIGGDGSGTASSGTIQSNTFNSAGNYFALGDDAVGGGDNSLPVTMNAFDYEADFGKVTLNWVTESEINNQGFNVYRATSADPENWQPINGSLIEGAGNSSTQNEYSYVDNTVAAGATYYYRLESVSLNGELEVFDNLTLTVDVPVPTEYALFNNYPNPFNPTTNIKFQLPEEADVTLLIYNMQGQLVNKLVSNARYSAGEHVVTWDATGATGQRVASGMYVYRFVANRFQKTGKMLLLK